MVNNYISNPYKEVNDNIFVCQVKLAGYEKDLKRIIEMSGPKPVQAQQYDVVIRSGGKIENVNDLFQLIVETKKNIEETKKQLEELKRTKAAIEEQFIRCLNDVERKVFLMKNKKAQYTLFDIACKLNKSEGYIKNISYQIDKKMINWLNSLPKNEINLSKM